MDRRVQSVPRGGLYSGDLGAAKATAGPLRGGSGEKSLQRWNGGLAGWVGVGFLIHERAPPWTAEDEGGGSGQPRAAAREVAAHTRKSAAHGAGAGEEGTGERGSVAVVRAAGRPRGGLYGDPGGGGRRSLFNYFGSLLISSEGNVRRVGFSMVCE